CDMKLKNLSMRFGSTLEEGDGVTISGTLPVVS
ncbi:hypothetical protein CLOM_g11890, partial [Closterium sp. NIES-68]